MVLFDDPFVRENHKTQLYFRNFGTLLRRPRLSQLKAKRKQQSATSDSELEEERRCRLNISDQERNLALQYTTGRQRSNLNSNGNFHPHVIPDNLRALAVQNVTDRLVPIASESNLTNERHGSKTSSLSSTNGPQRTRKRKSPTSFNLLILGTKSCGKTSFVNFIKSTLALPEEKKAPQPTDLREDIFAPPFPRYGKFEKHYLETVIGADRINLTIWDSEGLEEKIIDTQLQEISSFIDDRFEETFKEELKVFRAPTYSQDNHIHVAFLIFDPLHVDQNIASFKSASFQESWLDEDIQYSNLDVNSKLDEDIELKVLYALQGKVVVIPIISKADTITSAHMAFLKKSIREKISKAKLDPLDALDKSFDNEIDEVDDNSSSICSSYTSKANSIDYDHDLTTSGGRREIMSRRKCSYGSTKSSVQSSDSRSTSKQGNYTENSSFPLSIISPDIYEPNIPGRQFPWGTADPLNADHCDFLCLKNTIFYEWREDLRQVCLKILYENWRTNRLMQYVK